MARKPPLWVKKFRRISKEWSVSPAEIARRAGWTENTLSNALNKGHVPRADRGLFLERALGLKPGWLFDDSAGEWPPPKDVLIDDLALKNPKLAQVIDSRVASVLRSAADSVE